MAPKNKVFQHCILNRTDL